MFKEQMNKIKKMLMKNTEEKSEGKKDKKKIENLVAFLIILIITLIAINVILKDNSKPKENVDSAYKELAGETKVTEKSSNKDELEGKIESILETMSGVRESKSISNLLSVF